ncbi:MAG: efflux RND transporter permease subunit [Synoicihabitans sp.]
MLEALLRRGTLLTVILLIVCLFGVLAAFRVPVQMIPDLEIRTISVITSWPGATPQDVEKEILIEQEEYLRSIPNLQRIVSNASTGQANIQLEFPFGTDINDALVRVNNALSQVPAYPENVDEPRLLTSSFSNNAFLHFGISPLEGNPRQLNMTMMRDYVDDYVRTRLERAPGVSQVNLSGGAAHQIQIMVDPEKLASRSLTLTQVRNAIRERNRDRSGGDIDTGKRRYLIRTISRLDSPEELGQLIIAQRGDTLIRLEDVATVRLHHAEIRSIRRFTGVPILLASIQRETGANVIEVRASVLEAVEEVNRELLAPAGMKMELFNDDVVYVEDSIGNVWTNLSLGAALAAFVMFLFLRSVPLTLVGVLGIPICTIAAFLGLFLAGRTINVISLAGVAFAIGMTVDNTIVVLEAIEIERRRGKGRFEAAIAGLRRVWTAVLASTATTVLVFVPVLFVQEEAGQLYSDIAIAISAAIILSMIIAVTLVPAATARLKFASRPVGDRDPAPAPFKQSFIKLVHWLVATSRRRIAFIIGTIAFTGTALVVLTPPAEYLPEGEEAKTFARMIAPPGYSLEAMKDVANQVEAKFTRHVNADREEYDSGRTDVPPLKRFLLFVNAGSLMAIVTTQDPGDINPLMAVITTHFKSYPGMRAFASRGSIISSNDGGTRSVNLEISGAHLPEIYSTALAAYRRAEEVLESPQIGSSPSNLVLGQPLVEIRPRWDRAAEFGFTNTEFGYALAALADGAYVDEFFYDDNKVDIYLYSSEVNNRQIGTLGEMSLHTPRGGVLPVSALADIIETVDTDAIRRVDGRRTVTLNIIPPREIALETAVEMVRNEVVGYMRANGEIPPSVTATLSGASDQLDATRTSLGSNFIVSIILCFLLLVVIFTHWGYPFIILFTVPLGIGGGIIGLWLFNVFGAALPFLGLTAISQPFDMITMLGFLILLGTVVNNPILIVEETLANLRSGAATTAAAVEEALASRLRPIMMTTITTVCGLAPLVLIPGAGTELYRGVGAIVLFGLLFTSLITLTFLPVLLVTVLNWIKPKVT